MGTCTAGSPDGFDGGVRSVAGPLDEDADLTSLPTIDPARAVWLLTTLCGLHQKSVDAVALARECVPSVSVEHFVRIAANLGLSAIVTETALLNTQTPYPLIVPRTACGNAEGQVAAEPQSEWLLLVHSEGEQVVVSRFGHKSLERVRIRDLVPTLAGPAIHLRPAVSALADPDAAGATKRAFGFRWFIPELLKHKAIWREVLLASLVLQLIALAFPLFTQAIIDKVVVHRTESTLIALAIGMAVFIVFTTVLTWVRQYLVLHTGNRIDAVLGAEVFEHLFKLPPLYFQHRPTGVIAARLQGIETIREFVSSAAVTLMLDLPFLLIFVAIMFWYSVKLTVIVLAILALIVAASALVAPLFQRRLNEQFCAAQPIRHF